MTIYFRMGGSWTFALMPYGNLWRIHRRLMNRFFNPSVVNRFDDEIYKAVNVFLRRLSESPERFLKHAHLCVMPYSIPALSWTHRIPFDFEALLGHWPCRSRTG